MKCFFVSFAREKPGISPSGVGAYVELHLQSPQEIGYLAQLKQHQTQEGLLPTYFQNYPLWCSVGQSPGTPHVNKSLIHKLCMGLDLDSNQLAEIELARPAVEVLLTFPSEVSWALQANPQVASTAMFWGTWAFCREAERAAVVVRIGGGESDFFPAQILAFAYFHAENKAGEPHCHVHLLIFPSALDEFGTWRAYNSRALSDSLHLPGGLRRPLPKL